MSVCTFLTEYEPEVNTYLAKVKERLASNNFFKNPFTGKVVSITITKKEEIKQLNIIRIEPIWLDLTPFGWLIALTIYLIFGFNAFVLIGIIIGCLGIFWSKYFYTLIIFIGLKKAKYNGKFQMISATKALKYILEAYDGAD
jgi:hypothetical protein